MLHPRHPLRFLGRLLALGASVTALTFAMDARADQLDLSRNHEAFKPRVELRAPVL